MTALLFAALLFADARAAYDRASALFGKGLLAQSLDAVEEALRADPRHVRSLTLKARLAMAAKNWAIAEQTLAQATSIDPSSASAHFLLGFARFQRNELAQALEPLERARALAPKDPRAALYLGLVRESLGDLDPALALYEAALALEKPPSTETSLITARLYALVGRSADATKLIDAVLRRDPNSRDAWFERARLLSSAGDHEGAARAGETALTKPPGETAPARIHALLARSYQAMGRTNDAARHAQAARSAR